MNDKAMEALEDFELLVASLQAEVHDERFFPNVKSNLIPFGTYTRRNYAPSIENVRSALTELEAIKKTMQEWLESKDWSESLAWETLHKINYILKGETK